jgi:hypothetical protein
MFDRKSSLRPIFFQPETQISRQGVRKDPSTCDELRALWDYVAFEYSRGKLSNPDNKLPTISAIASEFYRIFGNQYLAGLWRENLTHDLLWIRIGGSGPGPQKPSYRIPAWSWASLNDRSTHPHCPNINETQSTRTQVLYYSVDLASREAPFNHIKGAS